MPSTAIGAGLALILVGIAGYVWGLMVGSAHWTAWFPAVFGAIIALLGALAKSNEAMRKHFMHGALLVALVGVVVPTYQLISQGSAVKFSPANVSRGAMALLCFMFLILGIQSFVSARRSRAV